MCILCFPPLLFYSLFFLSKVQNTVNCSHCKMVGLKMLALWQDFMELSVHNIEISTIDKNAILIFCY